MRRIISMREVKPRSQERLLVFKNKEIATTIEVKVVVKRKTVDPSVAASKNAATQHSETVKAT